VNDVTHSSEATSAVSASYAARHRRSAPVGVWGVSLLIATEAALFGTVLSSYYYLQFSSQAWPPPGIEPTEPLRPLVLTGALVATSIPVHLAARAARGARTRASWLWLALAVVVQCGYLAAQILLFHEDLSKFTPEDSSYGSIYFTMLGLHHAHVLVGILIIFWLLARLLSGLTNYRVNAVTVAAYYWHFVNVMAILVVLTQLSPSL
jgi:heme/copper-type cytochrome/quinol oxidase subunit 3